MSILIRHHKKSDVKPSEITPKSAFDNRRQFLKTAGITAGGIAASALVGPQAKAATETAKLKGVLKNTKFDVPDVTEQEFVTSYNNFYEFGTDKEDPFRYAGSLKPRPWTIKVSGHVEKPGLYDVDDLIKPHQLEERIYRFRCVEAWSMVVPWVGIPLKDIISRLGPTSNAKYVAFETLVDPNQMPGQRLPILQWPYREGLRLDEAMNDLTLMTVGLYGEVLPNQNGAPIRLIVPWKYGFKSIKSIVAIHFTEQAPPTSWNMAAAREYGFYSNVNPTVDHPRWSQAKERRIGGGFFSPKIKTLMFNGYEEEVADLYRGMDLTKHY